MITVKLDNKKRATIAQGKPGQVMAVTDNGDGSITLTPVQVPQGRAIRLKWAKDRRTFVMPDGARVELPETGSDPILDAVAEVRDA